MNNPQKNIEQVKNTLQILSAYWLKRPHLRLGQIITNSFSLAPEYSKNPEPEIADIFYLPDSSLLAGLLKLIENERESKSKRSTDA